MRLARLALIDIWSGRGIAVMNALRWTLECVTVKIVDCRTDLPEDMHELVTGWGPTLVSPGIESLSIRMSPLLSGAPEPTRDEPTKK